VARDGEEVNSTYMLSEFAPAFRLDAGAILFGHLDWRAGGRTH